MFPLQLGKLDHRELLWFKSPRDTGCLPLPPPLGDTKATSFLLPLAHSSQVTQQISPAFYQGMTTGYSVPAQECLFSERIEN